LHERLRARAEAECVSVSPVLRRFVLAYVREAAIGEPDTQADKAVSGRESGGCILPAQEAHNG
jgi:hypothetical protein